MCRRTQDGNCGHRFIRKESCLVDKLSFICCCRFQVPLQGNHLNFTPFQITVCNKCNPIESKQISLKNICLVTYEVVSRFNLGPSDPTPDPKRSYIRGSNIRAPLYLLRLVTENIDPQLGMATQLDQEMIGTSLQNRSHKIAIGPVCERGICDSVLVWRRGMTKDPTPLYSESSLTHILGATWMTGQMRKQLIKKETAMDSQTLSLSKAQHFPPLKQ